MFFANITTDYHAKNRLQSHVSGQLKRLECLSIEDPQSFKKYLETIVHRANLRFPRCRPLVAFLRTSYGRSDFTAGVSGLIQFSLYEQRGTFSAVSAGPDVTNPELKQGSLFPD